MTQRTEPVLSSLPRPGINIGGSKGKGTGHIKSKAVMIAPVTDSIWIDGVRQMADPYQAQFDQWFALIKNKQAPAIGDDDYRKLAEKWEACPSWVKATAEVECRNTGFEADGSVKVLFERHVLWQQLPNYFSADVAADLRKRLPDSICSRKPGGYTGGQGEWVRIRAAVCQIASITGNFDAALNAVLASASHGKFQVLGKWAKDLLDYPTPVAMVEAMHVDEAYHLEAYQRYVEKNNLARHLKSASENSSKPYPHIKKYAQGYNGKRCCDRGNPRKDYAEKIIRYQKAINLDYEDFKPLTKSRTILANAGSALSKITSGAGLSEVAELTNITGVSDALKRVEQVKTDVQSTVESIKGVSDAAQAKVAEAVQMAAELQGVLSDYQSVVKYLIVMLIASVGFNLYSMYARQDDRRNGRA